MLLPWTKCLKLVLLKNSTKLLPMVHWTLILGLHLFLKLRKPTRLLQENIKVISLVYESFLSRFPLCHGYWKTYAHHMARLCTVGKAVEIFERAVQAATYSVGLWVDYSSFSVLAFSDPSDIRRIFERGLCCVGKDFSCHSLWDMYIRFELSQQQWTSLAHILIRTLKFPTKSLHKYYDNFREFVAFIEEDMACQKTFNLEPYSAVSDSKVVRSEDDIYHVIKELQDSSNVDLRSKALYKYITIGEQFYSKACQLHEEIDRFENYMDREYFHVMPLDDEELENWHNYLDFIEKQKNFDWAVKLYERCLIPCANYPEFWMRYVEFMELKGGRELANFALERATQIFLKNVPQMHIFTARFKEQIGDIEGARAAFLLCDTESDSSFVETAIKEANMEKRLGNLATASDIYDKALKVAIERQKLHIAPILYIQYFRLKFQITGSADAAIDLLTDGIQCVPHSRLLLEELINFVTMHDGSRYLNKVDPIMATAITCVRDGSQGLSSKDREGLSCLYLKFVDLCGTTRDIKNAWNRHIKHFPHLIRRTSSSNHPTNQLFNELTEGRERICHFLADKPYQSHVSDHMVQISAHGHRLLPNQYRGKGGDNFVKETTPVQLEDDAAGEPKRLKHQSKEDASGLNKSLQDLRQIGETASRSIDSINDKLKPSKEVTSGPNKSNDLCKKMPVSSLQESETYEQEHELEASPKPVSSENLPLYTQEKASKDLPPRPPTALEDTILSINHQDPKEDEHESESLSSSPGHQNLEVQTRHREVPSKNTDTCCEMIPESEQLVSQVQGSTAPMGGENQVPNQNQSSVTKGNISNTWPVPTVQSHPQAQTVEYPGQSSEHLGHIQNSQAYNDMWNYQYQQQYQQQWIQIQQSYVQQQQLPYIQQQQHYMQHQLYQQQEQYQQYQAWLEQYQQQQGQGYQQMMQQHQMQEYLRMQYYQQQPQVVQQMTATPNQIWNGSHGQQGQGMTMTLPDGTSTTPYAQQNYAHAVTQQTIANAPAIVASPNHAAPTILASGTSKSLPSPSSKKSPQN